LASEAAANPTPNLTGTEHYARHLVDVNTSTQHIVADSHHFTSLVRPLDIRHRSPDCQFTLKPSCWKLTWRRRQPNGETLGRTRGAFNAHSRCSNVDLCGCCGKLGSVRPLCHLLALQGRPRLGRLATALQQLTSIAEFGMERQRFVSISWRPGRRWSGPNRQPHVSARWQPPRRNLQRRWDGAAMPRPGLSGARLRDRLSIDASQ
jgi:hypothetical protein